MLGARKQELWRVGGSAGITNPSTCEEFTEILNKFGNVP
jgi:hypothetical protein